MIKTKLLIMQTEVIFDRQNPLLRKYGSALRGKILILEGIISAGKSTAGLELAKECRKMGIKTKFYPEPLCQPLLKLFLSNQKKYAFVFQTTMLCKRQQIYQDAYRESQNGTFCIIDRSLHGDYCFAKMHNSNGNIDADEWNTYLKLLKDESFIHPDYLIYLKVSSSTALSRCAKRDRDGESAYTLEYFEDLCKVYDSVIEIADSSSSLVLDWNEERQSHEISSYLLDRINELYKEF